MGIFRQFPYSNFHDMNLDPILDILKTMQEEWEETKTEWATYKDFIDNYFANLDVSEEVLNAMRIFALDGTLNTIIDPVIATDVANWLVENITQPVGVVIDTSLTVSGACADAKATGDAIKDNSDNIYYLRGDKNTLTKISNIFGYQLPYYVRKAWNYNDQVKVDVNNVVMTNEYSYTPGDYIEVICSNDVLMRVTFINSGTPVANTGWLSGRRLRNTLSVDSVTVEFKNSDNSNITNIGEIVNKTAIIFESETTYFVNENEFSQYYNPFVKMIENEGFKSKAWSYGAYDFNGGNWAFTDAAIHCIYDSYNKGEWFTVYNEDPTTYRYRISFFSNNVSVGNTNWQTASRLSLCNVINGVDSFSIEVGYIDAHSIVDFNPLIRNVGIKTAPKERIIDDISTIGIFDKWATIGDSFSIGRWYTYSGGVYTPYKTSRLAWGSIISREVGNTFLSLGVGGATTRSWLTEPASSGGGLALTLASPKQDLYFLCLGINDTSLGSSYIGSVSDIHDNDYTLNADTFFGNYGKIIQQVKNYAPDALFVISKLVAWNDGSVKDAYNNAIEQIAQHYNIPCIDPEEDDYFTSTFWKNWRDHNNGHPTGMTYGGMAQAYQRLMNKAFNDYPSYFMYYVGVAD